MTTISLRLSVGARHCSTYARKSSPVIGPSTTRGAVSPCAAQSGYQRDRLPMSVRHATDQPLRAWATAAEPHHFSIGRGLVDEHQSARIKHVLLSNPAPARLGDVRSFLLRCAHTFLNVILCRAKTARARCGCLQSFACASRQAPHPTSNLAASQSRRAANSRASPMAKCFLRAASPWSFRRRASAAAI